MGKTKHHRACYLFFLVGLAALLNMVPAVLALLYSALVIPFTIFLYYGFIGTVPREIDEAAIIDGCTAGAVKG